MVGRIEVFLMLRPKPEKREKIEMMSKAWTITERRGVPTARSSANAQLRELLILAASFSKSMS